MPNWLTAFIFTALAAIAAPLASKMAVKTMHPLSAATVEAAMTLVAVMVIAAVLSRTPVSVPSLDNMGWALLAGGLWSFYVIGVYYTFSLGAPVSSSMAGLRALSIAGTTILAVMLLSERLAVSQWIGVVLILAGILLTLHDA
jgi:uncharacterized membrane protein